MAIFVLGGGFGNDAGWWEIVNGHVVHVGGWGVDSLAEVNSALAILNSATRLKTPGLADSVVKNLENFVQKELNTHLGNKLQNGAVVIFNASGA